VLLLPVSGPGGAGEFYRALAIANGIARRWPTPAIQFVVSRDAPTHRTAPYPTLLVGRSPTLETEAVNEIISRVRPARRHLRQLGSRGPVRMRASARRQGRVRELARIEPPPRLSPAAHALARPALDRPARAFSQAT
jgi:hypothetical protein